MDPSLVKLFRVAQLIMEYMLHTQDVLLAERDASLADNAALQKACDFIFSPICSQ